MRALFGLDARLIISPCSKKYYDMYSLTRHLQSPAHAGGRMVCICCKKAFPTVANLINHMETATNCRIRDTDDFRRVLGQVTGGILDFHPRSDTFFIDDKSAQELLNLRMASMTLVGAKREPHSGGYTSK